MERSAGARFILVLSDFLDSAVFAARLKGPFDIANWLLASAVMPPRCAKRPRGPSLRIRAFPRLPHPDIRHPHTRVRAPPCCRRKQSRRPPKPTFCDDSAVGSDALIGVRCHALSRMKCVRSGSRHAGATRRRALRDRMPWRPSSRVVVTNCREVRKSRRFVTTARSPAGA
jgi:hypothetical protein